MKKIKSVRLKREYRDTSHIMTEGQYGIRWFDEEEKKTFWKFTTQRTSYSFCEGSITGNLTDLFEIEYEEERKYIDVRIEANFSNFDIHYLRTVLYDYCHRAEFKVTELSEHWTDADLIDYNNFCDDNGYSREAWSIEKFKAERNNK